MLQHVILADVIASGIWNSHYRVVVKYQICQYNMLQQAHESTTLYRKPTHTDLYLQWDSNHTVSSKYSVVGSLHHRAQTICSSPELFQQDEEHLKQALTRCKYPAWTLNKVKIKVKPQPRRTAGVPRILATTSRNHIW